MEAVCGDNASYRAYGEDIDVVLRKQQPPLFPSVVGQLKSTNRPRSQLIALVTSMYAPPRRQDPSQPLRLLPPKLQFRQKSPQRIFNPTSQPKLAESLIHPTHHQTTFSSTTHQPLQWRTTRARSSTCKEPSKMDGVTKGETGS
jgi:hypothetical protein